MKDYIIGFSYSEFAKIQVRANSQTEAETIVYKMLDDCGMPEDCKIFDRDYSVDYGEEIKQ